MVKEERGKRKEDILIFLILVLALTYFIEISNYIIYGNKYKGLMSVLTSIFPLISAIIVEKRFNIKSILEDRFGKIYFIYFLISFITLCVSLKFEIILEPLKFMLLLGNMLGIYIVISDNKLLIGDFNLKVLAKWYFLFLILKNIEISVTVYYLYGSVGFKELLNGNIRVMTMGSFQTIFAIFFAIGEEYGWRYFLQPRLQQNFGKRWGVLLTGLIWGIWHLSLYGLLYYSDSNSLYSAIHILVYCVLVGIFLGLIYMKNNSILMVAIMHYTNNMYMSNIFDSGSDVLNNFEFSSRFLLFTIAVQIVLFLPFLFSKEYSNN